MCIRQRLGTEPHAAYPLPDPAVPADALAPARAAAHDGILAILDGTATAEDVLDDPAVKAALTIGDAAIVTRMTKRAMRARGAS